MTTLPNNDLTNWLRIATQNLPEDITIRVQDEITAHYEDALTTHQTAGKTEAEAHRAAMKDLGNPVYTRRALLKVHLSPLKRFITGFTEGIDRLESQNTPKSPGFWIKIALAISPGIFMFWWNGTDSALGTMPLISAIVCVILTGIHLFRDLPLPVWAYPALGVVLSAEPTGLLSIALPAVGVFTALGVWGKYRERNSHIPKRFWMLFGILWGTFIVSQIAISFVCPPSHGLDFFKAWNFLELWTLFGILVTSAIAMAGIPLVKRKGIDAGLFFVAASFPWWVRVLGFTFGLAQMPWMRLFFYQFAFWTLIVTPIWVLSANSTRAKVWGLLLPTFLGMLIAITIEPIVRANPTWLDHPYPIYEAMPKGTHFRWLWISAGFELVPFMAQAIRALQLFTTLICYVVFYHWINPTPATAQVRQPIGVTVTEAPDLALMHNVKLA